VQFVQRLTSPGCYYRFPKPNKNQARARVPITIMPRIGGECKQAEWRCLRICGHWKADAAAFIIAIRIAKQRAANAVLLISPVPVASSISLSAFLAYPLWWSSPKINLLTNAGQKWSTQTASIVTGGQSVSYWSLKALDQTSLTRFDSGLCKLCKWLARTTLLLYRLGVISSTAST